MNLTSPTQVKDWCIRNGFHPNRVLGQNFLIDRNALEAILDAALDGLSVAGCGLRVAGCGLSVECCGLGVAGCGGGDALHSNPQPSTLNPQPSTANYQLPTANNGSRGRSPSQTTNYQLPTVLEIGPGLGVLTEGLLARGCAVTAIEKDPVLADRLKAALGYPERLTAMKGDALDFIKRGACDGFPLMVSNLPYQAGTRILIELVERRGAPEKIVVLVQTEVAERLAAKEGSKTRGLAGVRVQLDYDVEVVRKVAASCFWPRPEVGSSVVRLVRHHRNDGVGEEVRSMFRRLTKRAFEHRRKQLGSVFKGMVESTARAEELSNEDWLSLAAAFTDADFMV